MIILGINSGFNLQQENKANFDLGTIHDASAALLVDGKIVSAIEEERLNRIKHTNKFPEHAIKTILTQQNMSLDEIDYFAFYATEEYVEAIIKKIFWADTTVSELVSPRKYLAQLFEDALDYKIDESKICFVDHHTAHASSSYYLSGFEESLVLTIDGVGEKISGRVLYGKGSEMEGKDIIPEINSLGHYYLEVVRFLGYDINDEYKVMGLAPYGNPAIYRDIFSLFYQLLPEGKFVINRGMIRVLLYEIGNPRRKGQEFDQLYKDVAAALQESLETIILHILTYHREKSGLDKLCLAGGVALNCSVNGKIYYSNLFEEIFIQPASHDAGCAIGSAFYTYVNKSLDKKIEKLDHVYLGTPIEEGAELQDILNSWDAFISFQKKDEVEEIAAELIADGKILGWVQGLSEFGPRALGNRSIIADPRPEKNKDIVNRMVKKREAYRPFAPSVLQEKADKYFEINSGETSFDYMTFVVKVKNAYRKELGAITHVDGTARIQTVNKSVNPKYWKLINKFGELSGVSLLLNTSLNNNVEPIVNTAEDAIVCFLTTGLDYLVIGDYLIEKKTENVLQGFNELVPRLKNYTVINSRNSFDSGNTNQVKYEIGYNYSSKYNREISKDVFDLISSINGEKTIREILDMQIRSNGNTKEDILQEINELWNLRLITLSPSYKHQKSFA